MLLKKKRGLACSMSRLIISSICVVFLVVELEDKDLKGRC